MNYYQNELNLILQDVKSDTSGYNIAKIQVRSINEKTKFLTITEDQLIKLIEVYKTKNPTNGENENAD